MARYTGTPTGGKRPSLPKLKGKTLKPPPVITQPTPYVRPTIESQPGPYTGQERATVQSPAVQRPLKRAIRKTKRERQARERSKTLFAAPADQLLETLNEKADEAATEQVASAEKLGLDLKFKTDPNTGLKRLSNPRQVASLLNVEPRALLLNSDRPDEPGLLERGAAGLGERNLTKYLKAAIPNAEKLQQGAQDRAKYMPQTLDDSLAPRTPKTNRASTFPIEVIGDAVNTAAKAISPEGSWLPNLTNLGQAAAISLARTADPTTMEGNAQYVKDAVAGSVSILYGVFTNPKGVAAGLLGVPEGVVEDLKQRYAKAWAGDMEGFNKDLEEYGTLPYLADMAVTVGAASKAAGGAARFGALGEKAQRFVTKPRARLSITDDVSRAQQDATQAVFPSALRVAAQRGIDAKRMAKHRKRMGKDARDAEGNLVREAGDPREANVRADDLTVADRRRKNTIKSDHQVTAIKRAGGQVHLRKGEIERIHISKDRAKEGRGKAMLESLKREGWDTRKGKDGIDAYPPRLVNATRRKRDFHARRLAPKAKGETLFARRQLSGDAAKEFDEITGGKGVRSLIAKNNLSKRQKAALFYTTQGLIHTANPEAAVRRIDSMIERIKNERADVSSPYKMDILPELEDLKANASEVFTKDLDTATNRMREFVRKWERGDEMGGRNEFLGRERAVYARYGPQSVEYRDELMPDEGEMWASDVASQMKPRDQEIAESSLPLKAMPIERHDLQGGEERQGAARYDRAIRKIDSLEKAGDITDMGAAAARARIESMRAGFEPSDPQTIATSRAAIDDLEVALERTTTKTPAGREEVKRITRRIEQEQRRIERAQTGMGEYMPAYRPESAVEFAMRVKGITNPERLRVAREAAAELHQASRELLDAIRRGDNTKDRAAALDKLLAEKRRKVGDAIDDLPVPAFVPHERFDKTNFKVHTSSMRVAPQPFQARKYEAQIVGRLRTDPEVILEGVQRNIQMRTSAHMVADILTRTHYKRFGSDDIFKQMKKVEAAGLAWDEVDFYVPRIWADRSRGVLVGAREAGQKTTADLETSADLAGGGDRTFADALGGGRRSVVGQKVDALRDREEHSNYGSDGKPAAIIRVSSAAEMKGLRDRGGFEQMKAYVVPRVVTNEIKSSVQSTAIGRGYERIKAAQSRAMLGFFNVPWLLADTAANTAVAAFIGGAGPTAFLKGSRLWWRRLSKEQRFALEQYLDIGSGKSQAAHRPHLGATGGHFSTAYRAFRQHPIGGAGKRPLSASIDQFLRLEKAVANDPARRAMFYKLLKSEAMRQIDADLGAFNGLMHRLNPAKIFSLGPEKQMKAILDNRELLDDLAQKLNEVLGDWSTFTSFERMTVGKLLFYPYLRYSTRLIFYSLPVNHPMRAAIIANMGAYTAEEQQLMMAKLVIQQTPGLTADEKKQLIKDVLTKDDYLMFGRYYAYNKDGQLVEYNFKNLNPLGNMFTEGRQLQDYLSMLPPVMTIALEQVLKRDLYRGRDWRINSNARREELEKMGPLDGFLGDERYRILLKELLGMTFVTRELTEWMLPGEQGDDSLPFSARATVFATEKRAGEAAKRLKEETGGEERLDPVETGKRSLFRAFHGKPSQAVEIIGRREANRRKERSQGKPKRKGSGSGFGGEGLGSGFGGSSF